MYNFHDFKLKFSTEKSNFWKFSLFLVYFDEQLADEEMSGDHGRCIGELEMQK